MTGTVKWFDARKGYGFITPDDGGEEVFVHHTAIQAKGYRQLETGQHVEYGEVKNSDKGLKAGRVVARP